MNSDAVGGQTGLLEIVLAVLFLAAFVPAAMMMRPVVRDLIDPRGPVATRVVVYTALLSLSALLVALRWFGAVFDAYLRVWEWVVVLVSLGIAVTLTERAVRAGKATKRQAERIRATAGNDARPPVNDDIEVPFDSLSVVLAFLSFGLILASLFAPCVS